MKAREIAQVLAKSAETIAAELLPHGKRVGGHWVAGSVDGEEGKSLKVLLTGGKAGQWQDFATGEGGDLLDLWRLTKGLSVIEAMREAQEWIGVTPKGLRGQERTYTRPEKPKCRAVRDTARSYLLKRGISEAALDAYRVADNGSEIVFPSLRDGELIAVKYRSIASKAFRQEAGQEPCLFGWQAIPKDARAVVICEGEIDALSWATWGIPALSVPMGGGTGGKHTWIETEYDHLERFDSIYLSFDADAPGQAALGDVAARLGRERCYVVDLPKKDANDCLRAGFSAQQAAQAITEARTLDPKELQGAAAYSDQILSLMYEQSDGGLLPPWDSIRDRLRFRDGELIVLAGATGHGKSQIVGELTACAMSQGVRACVASMEYRPARWLAHLVEQLGGLATGNITRDYATDCMDWLAGRLWVYDVDGGVDTAHMLEVFLYAFRRYGIKWFVIDNLSKCGIADDDYAAQKLFVEALADFARTYDVMVVLVHHMRKGHGDGEQTRSDIKGSGGITDMAHTVCTIWRNKPKEQQKKTAAVLPAELRELEEDDGEEEPDAWFRVTKQRETGDEPVVGLWFYPASRRFCEQNRRPRPYIPPRSKPAGDADSGGLH